MKKTLRLVYNDHDSSFGELLLTDNSLTIHERNIQKLAIEMYKVANNITPSFVKSICPLSTNPYNLRNKQTYEVENIHISKYGSETVSYMDPKTWALVPESIKNSISLQVFKAKIKGWKPTGCSCRLCKPYIANLGFI